MWFEFTDSYKNYLKSPRWKATCEAYWMRYGKRCQACGSARNLQVHHKTYDRFGGREKLTDLCGLCNNCHREVHAEHRKNRRMSLHLITDRFVVKKRMAKRKSL